MVMVEVEAGYVAILCAMIPNVKLFKDSNILTRRKMHLLFKSQRILSQIDFHRLMCFVSQYMRARTLKMSSPCYKGGVRA